MLGTACTAWSGSCWLRRGFGCWVMRHERAHGVVAGRGNGWESRCPDARARSVGAVNSYRQSDSTRACLFLLKVKLFRMGCLFIFHCFFFFLLNAGVVYPSQALDLPCLVQSTGVRHDRHISSATRQSYATAGGRRETNGSQPQDSNLAPAHGY